MHESKRRRESRSDVLGDVLSERFREYTLVYSLRLSKKPLGGIGGPQPSDFDSETGGVYVGFGCLAQQGSAC